MDFSELKQKVLDLVAEKEGDRGLVDSTEGQNLERFINTANRTVWRAAAKKQPQLFRVRGGEVTFIAATGRLEEAEFTESDSTKVRSIDLVEVKYGNQFFPVPPYDDPNQRFAVLEPSGPVAPPAGQVPYRWYQEAGSIYFSPPPVANLTVRVTFIPIVETMTNPTDVPIAGVLDEYHDLVALEAACAILRRDEHMKTPYDEPRDKMMAEMTGDLGRSQGQRTRRVRYDGPY